MYRIPAEIIPRLKQVLSGKDATTLSQVHVIGLEEIRQHFGDRWDEVQDKVFRHAQRAIDEALADKDMCLPCGRAGYILIFPAQARAVGEAKAEGIAATLRRRLLGEGEPTSHLKIGTVTVSGSGEAILEELANPKTAPKIEASTEVQSNPSEGPVLVSSTAGRTPSLEELAPPEMKPVTREAAAPKKVCYDLCAPCVQKPAAIQFSPVWFVEKELVVNYSVRPEIDCVFAAPRKAWSNLTTSEGRDAAMALDLQTLVAVGQSLELVLSQGRRMLQTPMISTALFYDATRQAALHAVMARMSEEVRKHMQLVIIDTVQGADSPLVRLAAKIMKPLLREITLVVGYGDRTLKRAKEAGFKAIGLDLGLMPNLEPSLLMDELTTFRAQAKSVGLDCFLAGVEMKPMLMKALKLGFEFIGGPAIAASTETPGKVIRLSRSQLLTPLQLAAV